MKEITAQGISSLSLAPHVVIRSRVTEGLANTIDHHINLELNDSDLSFLLQELASYNPALITALAGAIHMADEQLNSPETSPNTKRMWEPHGVSRDRLFREALQNAIDDVNNDKRG